MFDFFFGNSNNASNKNSDEEIISNEDSLKNYKIIKTQGQGTFGTVKLAIHNDTKKHVAIKMINKSMLSSKDDRQKLEKEINYLISTNHPNIIKIYEIIETKKCVNIVMENASHGELFNLIVDKKRLEVNEASYYFFQIVQGLEYLHSIKGICHRDLKPENILINSNNNIKIIDFGLSTNFIDKKGHKFNLETSCGSPCYASPEMVSGEGYDAIKSDYWSLGVTLYAMCCGYLPFENDNTNQLYREINKGIIQFPKFIDKRAKNLIKKLLSINPNKRPDLKEIKKSEFYQLSSFSAINSLKLESDIYEYFELINDKNELNDSLNKQNLNFSDNNINKYHFYENLEKEVNLYKLKKSDYNIQEQRYKFKILIPIYIDNICLNLKYDKNTLLTSIRDQKLNNMTSSCKILIEDFFKNIEVNIDNSSENKDNFLNKTMCLKTLTATNKDDGVYNSNLTTNRININFINNTSMVNINNININLKSMNNSKFNVSKSRIKIDEEENSLENDSKINNLNNEISNAAENTNNKNKENLKELSSYSNSQSKNKNSIHSNESVIDFDHIGDIKNIKNVQNSKNDKFEESKIISKLKMSNEFNEIEQMNYNKNKKISHSNEKLKSNVSFSSKSNFKSKSSKSNKSNKSNIESNLKVKSKTNSKNFRSNSKSKSASQSSFSKRNLKFKSRSNSNKINSNLKSINDSNSKIEREIKIDDESENENENEISNDSNKSLKRIKSFIKIENVKSKNRTVDYFRNNYEFIKSFKSKNLSLNHNYTCTTNNFKKEKNKKIMFRKNDKISIKKQDHKLESDQLSFFNNNNFKIYSNNVKRLKLNLADRYNTVEGNGNKYTQNTNKLKDNKCDIYTNNKSVFIKSNHDFQQFKIKESYIKSNKSYDCTNIIFNNSRNSNYCNDLYSKSKYSSYLSNNLNTNENINIKKELTVINKDLKITKVPNNRYSMFKFGNSDKKNINLSHSNVSNLLVKPNINDSKNNKKSTNFYSEHNENNINKISNINNLKNSQLVNNTKKCTLFKTKVEKNIVLPNNINKSANKNIDKKKDYNTKNSDKLKNNYILHNQRNIKSIVNNEYKIEKLKASKKFTKVINKMNQIEKSIKNNILTHLSLSPDPRKKEIENDEKNSIDNEIIEEIADINDTEGNSQQISYNSQNGRKLNMTDDKNLIDLNKNLNMNLNLKNLKKTNNVKNKTFEVSNGKNIHIRNIKKNLKNKNNNGITLECLSRDSTTERLKYNNKLFKMMDIDTSISNIYNDISKFFKSGKTIIAKRDVIEKNNRFTSSYKIINDNYLANFEKQLDHDNHKTSKNMNNCNDNNYKTLNTNKYSLAKEKLSITCRSCNSFRTIEKSEKKLTNVSRNNLSSKKPENERKERANTIDKKTLNTDNLLINNVNIKSTISASCSNKFIDFKTKNEFSNFSKEVFNKKVNKNRNNYSSSDFTYIESSINKRKIKLFGNNFKNELVDMNKLIYSNQHSLRKKKISSETNKINFDRNNKEKQNLISGIFNQNNNNNTVEKNKMIDNYKKKNENILFKKIKINKNKISNIKNIDIQSPNQNLAYDSKTVSKISKNMTSSITSSFTQNSSKDTKDLKDSKEFKFSKNNSKLNFSKAETNDNKDINKSDNKDKENVFCLNKVYVKKVYADLTNSKGSNITSGSITSNISNKNNILDNNTSNNRTKLINSKNVNTCSIDLEICGKIFNQLNNSTSSTSNIFGSKLNSSFNNSKMSKVQPKRKIITQKQELKEIDKTKDKKKNMEKNNFLQHQNVVESKKNIEEIGKNKVEKIENVEKIEKIENVEKNEKVDKSYKNKEYSEIKIVNSAKSELNDYNFSVIVIDLTRFFEILENISKKHLLVIKEITKNKVYHIQSNNDLHNQIIRDSKNSISNNYIIVFIQHIETNHKEINSSRPSSSLNNNCNVNTMDNLKNNITYTNVSEKIGNANKTNVTNNKKLTDNKINKIDNKIEKNEKKSQNHNINSKNLFTNQQLKYSVNFSIKDCKDNQSINLKETIKEIVVNLLDSIQ